MKRRYIYYIISIALVIIISLGILGNIYRSLTHNYSYLGLLHSSPQEVIVENRYCYSLEEINNFRENYSISFLYFPIGRPIPNISMVKTYLNAKEAVLPVVNDGVGGSWVNVSFGLFTEDLDVILRFIQKKSTKKAFKDPNSNATDWIKPYWPINSDNKTVIEVAQNITKKINSKYEKAKEIFHFVRNNLEYKYPSYASEVASRILFSEYGQCIQFSNLFVALCRAVQIPARTVQGYYSNDSFFKISHQWAEFMDKDGYWHQVDASVKNKVLFDFSDPRYFDFYYTVYQNPFDPSQTYFPSLWYSSGELSIKSVTMDLESNLELCLYPVTDLGFVLWLCFVVGAFIFLDYVKQRKKQKKGE